MNVKEISIFEKMVIELEHESKECEKTIHENNSSKKHNGSIEDCLECKKLCDIIQDLKNMVSS